MTRKSEPGLITDPLTPKATHGRVEIKDPPASAMNMTADAAEISGLRLVDAADRARENATDAPPGKKKAGQGRP